MEHEYLKRTCLGGGRGANGSGGGGAFLAFLIDPVSRLENAFIKVTDSVDSISVHT